MSRLVVPVELWNPSDESKRLCVEALVHTGAAYVTLPSAWREELGELEELEALAGMADGSARTARLCAPVKARIEDFRIVTAEALFFEMEPDHEGKYGALIGYIALEQANAVVDMANRRLVQRPLIDLK